MSASATRTSTTTAASAPKPAAAANRLATTPGRRSDESGSKVTVLAAARTGLVQRGVAIVPPKGQKGGASALPTATKGCRNDHTPRDRRETMNQARRGGPVAWR